MTTATTTRPASQRQTDFIRTLLADRDVPPDHAAKYLTAVDHRALDMRTASSIIEWLLARPHRCAIPAAQQVTEEGMYRVGVTVYKVQRSHGSGRLYAKQLHGRADTGNWYFEYAGNVNRLGITVAHRMTLEEATAWGAQFGTCCVCAATLTNPASIAAGIGPVCASRV